MTERAQPLIVGAGPAGVRAAQALVAAGLRPIVVDEGHASGGQIYRQPLQPDGRSPSALYGSEARKAERLHRAFDSIRDKIDYRPKALVWDIRDGFADIAAEGRTKRLAYDGAIVATGASDRILPLPGWTLPGVFTLGGAQVAMKAQGCAVGSRVIFVGTGPLLYLVAWQYLRAGVKVAAVLDAAPAMARFKLLPGLALLPAVVLRGVRFVAELTARGVPIHHGVRRVRFVGHQRLEGVSFAVGQRDHHIACDGAGYGLALRSETQLADLAGCTFAFDERDRAFLPVKDHAGRSSVPGLYLAGDGAGIAGADAAELTGERAAFALLEDRGLPFDRAQCAALGKKLARINRFRSLLEKAFPFPAHWIEGLPDDMPVCRCENVSVGDIKAVVADFAISEVNRLKAIARPGMGRCQGRMCGNASAELLAARSGRALSEVGRLRAQAPVKPLPFSLTAAETGEASP